MKILVVSQYFYPENFRINELCLTLKERGHDITVLTGKPNYPTGKLFEGYSVFGKEDEVWNGIPILRSALIPRASGSIRLILNYISFVFFGKRRAKKLKKEHYDVIYVFEVSPITVAYPALALKKKTGIPVVINIQDLWPENIVAVTGMKNRFVLRMIDGMVNSIYKQCDIILAASNSFVDKIQSRVDNRNKVIYWPQYSTISKKQKFEQMFSADKFNIVFTGNIGVAQNLELVIDAANQLRGENICWHIVGDGRNKQKLMDKVTDMKLHDDVVFYDAVDESLVPDYLQSADVALLILKPDPVFDLTLPAKLQTYMACGCAILGCVAGEAKKVVSESNSGVVCNDLTIDELVNKALYLKNLKKSEFEIFGFNAKQYNDSNFAKLQLIEKLENYFDFNERRI